MAEEAAERLAVVRTRVLLFAGPALRDLADLCRVEVGWRFAAVGRDECLERRCCVRVLPVRLLVVRDRSRDGPGRCWGFFNARIAAWCAVASASVGNAARRLRPCESVQSAMNLPHFFSMGCRSFVVWGDCVVYGNPAVEVESSLVASTSVG